MSKETTSQTEKPKKIEFPLKLEEGGNIIPDVRDLNGDSLIKFSKEQEKEIIEKATGLNKKTTKEEKFNEEIDALKIVAIKITELTTYILFQKKAVKNWKNLWATYSGRPGATNEEAIKDFMKSKRQMAY